MSSRDRSFLFKSSAAVAGHCFHRGLENDLAVHRNVLFFFVENLVSDRRERAALRKRKGHAL